MTKQVRWVLALVLAGLVLGALAGTAYGADAARIEPLRAPFSPGWRLEVDNTIGEVIVRGGDGDQVTGEARVEVENADDAEAAHRFLEKIRIEVEQTPGGVTIRTHGPGALWRRKVGYWVRIELEAPRQMDLYASVDVGQIEVESVHGDVRCEADVGELKLKAIHGSIEARTRVGEVEAELVTHDGRTPVVAESNIGEVKLTLPRDMRGHLDASANIGQVRSDFDVVDDGFEWLGSSRKGPIHGGGPTIRVRTNVGQVRIRAAD